MDQILKETNRGRKQRQFSYTSTAVLVPLCDAAWARQKYRYDTYNRCYPLYICCTGRSRMYVLTDYPGI